MVARTGYTGEKGVELCCAEDAAEALWDAVVARGAVPCGLGARDTLRLEVCYPLHGNDITPETDAISAGLGWACALDKEFTGVEVLRRVKEEGPAATARRVRHGREGRAAPGHADRGRRRGDLRHALADARPGHRDGLRAVRERRAGHRARRSTSAASRGAPTSSRSRSTAKERASARRGELPRRSQVPPRARLGADRGGRGDARDHLVRAGRARRARPLRAARGRLHRREGRRPTARSSR